MNDDGPQRRRQLEEETHGGVMNVFAMALNGMDQTEIGWMMVAVIFSQLVLDEALRRAEAAVGTNARACLREVYKELSTVSTVVCLPARFVMRLTGHCSLDNTDGPKHPLHTPLHAPTAGPDLLHAISGPELQDRRERSHATCV